MPIPESKAKYTYADYLTWPKIANYLVNNPCRVFAAPFDLCIPEQDEEVDEEISNAVSQPDIVVVGDERKLRKTGYFGAPELIIEITSTSTAKWDKLIKFNKFEIAGVKEYWIVEPEQRIVSVFMLQENHRYGRAEVYAEEDKINVSIFPDLLIDLSPVFAGI